MSNNSPEAMIASISADFLSSMLRNPNVDPNDPDIAEFAVAQAVSLDNALGARFSQSSDNH